MEESLRISDGVWHRVVQIIQEAMLTGVDCADLLRLIRVKVANVEGEGTVVVLTDAYSATVAEQHKKLLEEALALKAQREQLQ